MKYRVCFALTVLTLLSSLAAARPDADSNDHQRQRFETVWKKLLDNMEPVPGMEWPPKYEIEEEWYGQKYNAFATCRRVKDKIYPLIRTTWTYLREVCTDDNALALTIGHELGHIYHRHFLEYDRLRPLAAGNAHIRSQEYEADLFGARLAVKAEYSLRKGILAMWRGMERSKSLYSSLIAFEVDHPGWADRFARLAALLDNEQLALWRSMSSYQNGVIFLGLQQYEAAELRFERVVREFPKCHEAWANLGVARLMQYCEALSAEDLRRLGVGQILGASFYRQPGSPIELRGDKQEERWQKAVEALRTSLDLRRDQALVRANLGLAYLVHPGGRAVGLGDAEHYLQEAAEAIARADELDQETQVVLLVNLGVARLAGGSRVEGLRLLEKAEALEPLLRRSVVGYNRAMALATGPNRAEQTEAADILEIYLRGNDPHLTWWTLAYERYRTLCSSLGRPAQERDELQPPQPARSRPCLSVTLAGGKTIALTDPVEEVVRRLGEKPRRQTKETGSSFRRLTFPQYGIELLVDEQEVVAILLTGPAAPPLTVRGKEWGSDPQAVLRVGMTRKEVEAMPGGTKYVHRPLTQFGRLYHYYRDLRLAVHFDRPGSEGVLQELVLVVIPEGDF